ncbi:hypothetical protein PHLCEN_2v7897 [Hermanssonia centrifuga]|uniref:Uncharacterized protein n=1 Tax=Hermanssonia centrifuga TaxID=98765 RepID=A0A2R6NVC5_9APHY|nr:hypothetical protein PHLCEN_2v7897 [Hermanssonia centrifuga]
MGLSWKKPGHSSLQYIERYPVEAKGFVVHSSHGYRPERLARSAISHPELLD